MLEIISAIISSKLFWVTLFQWAVFTPLVRIATSFIRLRVNQYLVMLADLLVLFGVAFLVFAVPLFILDMFPLPVRHEKSAFIVGFGVGGLLSVQLKKLIDKWLGEL